jgi:hypothetical protein
MAIARLWQLCRAWWARESFDRTGSLRRYGCEIGLKIRNLVIKLSVEAGQEVVKQLEFWRFGNSVN